MRHCGNNLSQRLSGISLSVIQSLDMRRLLKVKMSH